MKRASGQPQPHRWPVASGQVALGQGGCGLSGAHAPCAAHNASQHNSSHHNALLGTRAASGRPRLAGVPSHPGHAATLAAQPVAGSPHHWRHVLRKRLPALWLLLACALVASCADDSAQQQQAQALLRHGLASDIRHNTLMDAAFGTENERIVPGEVYWQALLPLPQVLSPSLASSTQASPNAAQAGQADQGLGPQLASPRQSRSQLPNPPLNKSAGKPSKQQEAFGVGPVLATGAIQQQLVAVRPREAVRLNDDQVALVVESLPANQLPRPNPAGGATEGGPAAVVADAASAEASNFASASATAAVPAHIGVIFFQAEAPAPAPTAGKGSQRGRNETGAGQWRAVRLVPHVDALMTGPTMPDVQVYRLDASRYLVTYMQTACQTGACSRWLKGYLLQPEAMQPVFSTRLAASNVEQWADCPARLGLTARAHAALAERVRQLHAQPGDAAAASMAVPASQQASGSGRLPAHGCHAVLGEVHLISRGSADAADVQIRYSGLVSDAPGQLRPIAQAQLFRLQGEQWVQIDGAANPVPAQP